MSSPSTFDFDGASWCPLQLPRAASLHQQTTASSTHPHQPECPGWRRVPLDKRRKSNHADDASTAAVQLTLVWTDEHDEAAIASPTVPAPSAGDDCFSGALGDLLLSIRCSSAAAGGSHVLWFKEHSLLRTAGASQQEAAEQALRAYFHLPAGNSATLGTLASLLSSNASLSTPTRSSSTTRSGQFAASPTLERAERETAFWQTVERIALGLKRDVEQTQLHSPTESLGHSTGSHLTSSLGSTSSAFTLTAHISSTLNQIMHLHYESKELETRIDTCKDTLGRHAHEVDVRTKNIHDWVHARRKQAKLDGDKAEPLTDEEAKLLRRIARLLRADTIAASASGAQTNAHGKAMTSSNGSEPAMAAVAAASSIAGP